MAQAGETAEHEHIPDPFQGGTPGRNLEGEQLLYLVDRQEDDLLLRGDQVRLVGLEVHHGVVLVHSSPFEEPLQIPELLEYGRVRLPPQKSLLECSGGDFSIKVYQIM